MGEVCPHHCAEAAELLHPGMAKQAKPSTSGKPRAGGNKRQRAAPERRLASKFPEAAETGKGFSPAVAPHQVPEGTPTLEEICRAPWPTMLVVPQQVLVEWALLFMDELKAFCAFPAEPTLQRLYLVSKLLLAAPLHGGRQKAAATVRIIAKRLALWRSNLIADLWRQVSTSWNRKPRQYQRTGNPATHTFSRARMFADFGLPGKACSILCSRGVADPTEAFDKVQALFPQTSEDIPVPEPYDVDVDIALVTQVLKKLHRGLAP